jgi:hypothetical protein
LDKNGFGYTLGDIFKNLSGQPVCGIVWKVQNEIRGKLQLIM